MYAWSVPLEVLVDDGPAGTLVREVGLVDPVVECLAEVEHSEEHQREHGEDEREFHERRHVPDRRGATPAAGGAIRLALQERSCTAEARSGIRKDICDARPDRLERAKGDECDQHQDEGVLDQRLTALALFLAPSDEAADVRDHTSSFLSAACLVPGGRVRTVASTCAAAPAPLCGRGGAAATLLNAGELRAGDRGADRSQLIAHGSAEIGQRHDADNGDERQNQRTPRAPGPPRGRASTQPTSAVRCTSAAFPSSPPLSCSAPAEGGASHLAEAICDRR